MYPGVHRMFIDGNSGLYLGRQICLGNWRMERRSWSCSVDRGLFSSLPRLFLPVLWLAVRRVRLVGEVVEILRAPFLIALHSS